jgi:2-oxoglutarate dehydrogenase E1 component
MDIWKEFHGPNAGYILELYEQFQENPESVDAQTRRYFENWSPPTMGAAVDGRYAQNGAGPSAAIDKVVAAVNLGQAIREFGHLAAQLDPLGSTPPDDPALRLESYNLTEADLRQLPASLIGGPVAAKSGSALEAVADLRRIYSGAAGFDFEHIRLPNEREWLRTAVESGRFRPPSDPINPTALLERLTEVEVFEQFLHRLFPGKTRFSIEGLDMMVPILDELLGDAANAETCLIPLGMAHRGRLNVLAHVLAKPYEHILAEFKDPGGRFGSRDELGWTGDVKYHKGQNRNIVDGEEVELVVYLAPNPSHLEHVNPVVLGMARAADSDTSKAGPPRRYENATMPVLIHGDASFPGQGIVAETLNMSRLPGYNVGGTIHIIANNQLGFTTTTIDARSTLYASDLAKGFKIPVIHLNADDVTSCIEAVRLACAYRTEFRKDIVIDLIGYRRYGHNEGDEPSFTQPGMYEKIEAHPTVRRQWAEKLVAEGIVAAGKPDELVQRQMNDLQEAWESLEIKEEFLEPDLEMPPPGAAARVETKVPIDQLRDLNAALMTMPQNFTPHPKLERAMKRRRSALDDPEQSTIDWATAEELALASILAQGTPIRFTGEDVERGTFSQRHAVFHDVNTGEKHLPLQHIPQAKAAFEIHNSPLSENAAVGFEYGYNIAFPGRMTIWEAQYGDFINAAQAIIDEFVVSGRAKWEQTPSLVLLLPHGYEGQGPDHSTGRLERFLQMAAETNQRVANPTTAAQYFHLLRRQAALLKEDPLPLIIMTPKSLLRHRLAASTPKELAEGRWQMVIDDAAARERPQEIRRLVLCSGKVYVDLVSSDLREAAPAVALVRVEQLYRFPAEELKEIIAAYPKLEEVVWLQEEPQNMGAWEFVRPCLEPLLEGKVPLNYIGRRRRASPAEGSATWHRVNQEAIVKKAFKIG